MLFSFGSDRLDLCLSSHLFSHPLCQCWLHFLFLPSPRFSSCTQPYLSSRLHLCRTDWKSWDSAGKANRWMGSRKSTVPPGTLGVTPCHCSLNSELLLLVTRLGAWWQQHSSLGVLRMLDFLLLTFKILNTPSTELGLAWYFTNLTDVRNHLELLLNAQVLNVSHEGFNCRPGLWLRDLLLWISASYFPIQLAAWSSASYPL